MARARLCDRCRRVYACVDNRDEFYDGRLPGSLEPRGTTQGIIVVSDEDRGTCVDLCDDCMRELKGFLHAKQECQDIGV